MYVDFGWLAYTLKSLSGKAKQCWFFFCRNNFSSFGREKCIRSVSVLFPLVQWSFPMKDKIVQIEAAYDKEPQLRVNDMRYLICIDIEQEEQTRYTPNANHLAVIDNVSCTFLALNGTRLRLAMLKQDEKRQNCTRKKNMNGNFTMTFTSTRRSSSTEIFYTRTSWAVVCNSNRYCSLLQWEEINAWGICHSIHSNAIRITEKLMWSESPFK